jgi:E3 ubiquitin-protein ligase RNF14
LEDFWKLCIQEGDVGRVGCPDPECVGARKEAEEEEVARIVTPDEVERWQWLREKRALEKDPTMLHCPLQFCQAAVPKPQSPVDDESGWSRLRTCQSCGFSFCSFCKRTW